MLDAAFIRDNVGLVKANCVNRNLSTVAVERVVEFDAKRRELVQKRSETAAKKMGPEVVLTFLVPMECVHLAKNCPCAPRTPV